MSSATLFRLPLVRIAIFVLTVFLIPVYGSQFVYAQATSSEGYTVAGANDLGWDNVRDPMGGIPFVQGALGAADYDTVDGAFNGHQMNVRAGLSYYLPNRTWVFDGSFGLHHGKIESVDSSLLSFVAEGAARYRFLAYWSAGPILNLYLGNGGTFQSSSSLLTSFLGVEVARDIPLDSNIMRVSFRMMTDINVPDIRANMMMLNFAWSFPIGRTSPEVIASLQDERGIRRRPQAPVLVEEKVESGAVSQPLALETESEKIARPEEIYNVKPKSNSKRVEDLAVASIKKSEPKVAKPAEVANAEQTKPNKPVRGGSEMELAREIAAESASPTNSYDSVPVVPGNSDQLSTRAASVGRGDESPEVEAEKPRGPGEVVRMKVADFGIGRVVPVKGQEQKIERLGQALAQNSHLYERIEVIGHSDSNGQKSNLEKVARYRARGVLELLAKSGLPRSIMQSRGLGDEDTLGTGKWDRLNGRNRRVELRFFGVHSPKELSRLVERTLL